VSRSARLVTLTALVSTLLAHDAAAHAGLRRSDPLAGATLGASPAAVTLTFSEPPDQRLSEIRVSDAAGAAYQIGSPIPVSGEPLAVSVPLKRLDRGVYVVTWHVVSAVDGHASAGTFTFGVLADPGATAMASTSAAAVPTLEAAARALFIAGVAVLLGASAAGAMRFGGASDLVLAAAGCGVAGIGVALLALAQRSGAGASWASLAQSPIGHGLEARGAALALAGAAVLVAGWIPDARRPRAAAAAGGAALIAIAAHVSTGHAGSGTSSTLAIASQTLHFAAAGVWGGGLLALLLGLRGAETGRATTSIRAFSRIAAGCLVAVVATGLVRSFGELASLDELHTVYGRLVAVKVAAVVALAALGAANRWWSVPRAAVSMRPLLRLGAVELSLALAAIVVAAFLGALPPPAAARVPVISASAVDFATTMRLRLTAASDQPGPNRFTLDAVDYDSGAPVAAHRVSLSFTALDDPDFPATRLDLAPVGAGRYEGSGANIAFEGRWRLTASIERDRESIQVPMIVETRTAPQFVSTARFPGEKPMFTVEVRGLGNIRFIVDAERPGLQGLTVAFLDVIREPRPMTSLVVTARAPGRDAERLTLDRTSSSAFHTAVALAPGENVLVATGRTADGARMRAALRVIVPR
jgi:copper transport protein